MESRWLTGMTAKCTPSQLPASGIEYAEHFPLARCVGSLKLRAAEAKQSERRLLKRSEEGGSCALLSTASRHSPTISLRAMRLLRWRPSVLDKSCYPTQATWTMCVSECLTLRAPCIAWFLSGSAAPSMMCICMARRIPIDRDPFAHRSWRYCFVSRIMLSSAGPEPRSSPADSSGMLSVRDFRPRSLGAVGAYGTNPVDKPSTHRRLSRAMPRSRWPCTCTGGSAVCLCRGSIAA